MGIDYGYGKGETRGLSVRPLRARVAPTRQVAGPHRLPEVQEPILEHSSPQGRVRGQDGVEFSSWSASPECLVPSVPDGGCGWGAVYSPPATNVAEAQWRNYTTASKFWAKPAKEFFGAQFCQLRTSTICKIPLTSTSANPRIGTHVGASSVTCAMEWRGPFGHPYDPSGLIGAVDGGCQSSPPGPSAKKWLPTHVQVWPCVSTTKERSDDVA